jgi:carbon monoxide dehydrogenase subunit G
MEIFQSFTVPYPREVVWAAFHDTCGILVCLPGALLRAPADDGRLRLAMTVKLGSIAASFTGEGKMSLDDTAWCGSISGDGVDRKSASRVQGKASFSLDGSTLGKTRVHVKVNYMIAGSMVQFSRSSLVKELAARITDVFAANLKARLDHQAAQMNILALGKHSVLLIEPARDTHGFQTGTPDTKRTEAASYRRQGHSSSAQVHTSLNLGPILWRILWWRLRIALGFGAH